MALFEPAETRESNKPHQPNICRKGSRNGEAVEGSSKIHLKIQLLIWVISAIFLI